MEGGVALHPLATPEHVAVSVKVVLAVRLFWIVNGSACEDFEGTEVVPASGVTSGAPTIVTPCVLCALWPTSGAAVRVTPAAPDAPTLYVTVSGNDCPARRLALKLGDADTHVTDPALEHVMLIALIVDVPVFETVKMAVYGPVNWSRVTPLGVMVTIRGVPVNGWTCPARACAPRWRRTAAAAPRRNI
jgi:hypothetical protein